MDRSPLRQVAAAALAITVGSGAAAQDVETLVKRFTIGFLTYVPGATVEIKASQQAETSVGTYLTVTAVRSSLRNEKSPEQVNLLIDPRAKLAAVGMVFPLPAAQPAVTPDSLPALRHLRGDPGLFQQFGKERVRDTPISETAIVGAAIGAAANGLRPIVEIMFMDFIGTCWDHVVNQMAKMRYMFGGQMRLPLVLRTHTGAGLNAGPQHSGSLEAWAVHVPGLKVVMPSTPADMKGLLKAAIRDDNPVIVVENKTLYAMKGEVPAGDHLVPIGRAEVKRTGSDVTVVAVSRLVHGKTLGGHLVSGCKIYTTAEIVILAFPGKVYKREFAEDSGYDELTIYKK